MLELGGPLSSGPHGGVDVLGLGFVVGWISKTLADVELLCCAAWVFICNMI